MKESEVQDRQGHWHRMQIRPYKTADNKIDGAILSLVDIDALKHHVNEAQSARAEAERANHAKDLFLAILGHELRTPLSSLLLRGQMLRQGGAMDSAKLVRTGEAIERATRMQIQLVDDLLDVSRIVAGKLKVERRAVDLASIVRAALEGVYAAARRKSIQLEVRVDENLGPVSGDATRLQQVVSNLLTNAIKFTPESGRVAVTVKATGDMARITVTDTGVGIEPSFLPHVFNRFSQEDSSNTRLNGGLGLGLAIVRHLVEQHGGTVEAQSDGIGKGALFSVALPLMKAHLDAPDEGAIFVSGGVKDLRNAHGNDQFKGLRVLVVDDDLATREVVAEMLKELGAKVETAESAAKAMAVVGEFKPRVLLCDIAMPGEDGYSFIRRLRARDGDDGGNTPAVALTALASEDDHHRALAAGFQLHLTKPVDIEHLSDAVIELAERRNLGSLSEAFGAKPSVS
jgi:two-component system CheB/CheR fusion protein